MISSSGLSLNFLFLITLWFWFVYNYFVFLFWYEEVHFVYVCMCIKEWVIGWVSGRVSKADSTIIILEEISWVAQFPRLTAGFWQPFHFRFFFFVSVLMLNLRCKWTKSLKPLSCWNWFFKQKMIHFLVLLVISTIHALSLPQTSVSISPLISFHDSQLSVIDMVIQITSNEACTIYSLTLKV